MKTVLRLWDGVHERFYEVDPAEGPQPQGPGEALLVSLVRFLQPSVVVEVGTLYAQTTVCLAAALPPGGIVYTLECRPTDSMWEVLRFWGLQDRIRIVIGESAQTIPTLPDGIEFVYVDGNHLYPSIKTDGDLLWPKVAPGGIMAFDDLTGMSPAVLGGPALYVSERFPGALILPAHRGLAVVQKPPQHLHMDDGSKRGWPFPAP